MPDEHIPGTLNIGHTPPTIVQAFVFIAIVQVDMTTLILLIAAAVGGAWLGAGIVAELAAPQDPDRDGAGAAAAAALFLMTNLGLFPPGGNTLDLQRTAPRSQGWPSILSWGP